MSMQASMPSSVQPDAPVAEAAPRNPNPTWGHVIGSVFAVVFDLIMVFLVGGYAVAYLTGNIKDGEFHLSGGPVGILMLVLFAYFIICLKFFGGTLWQHTLRVARR